MEREEIERQFVDQLIEMTQLHKRYLQLQEDYLLTRWYQLAIRRDLNQRQSRIIKRIRELVTQRDMTYNEYLKLIQTDNQFQDILKREGWNN